MNDIELLLLHYSERSACINTLVETKMHIMPYLLIKLKLLTWFMEL